MQSPARRRRLVACLAASLLGGCAGLLWRPEPPRVTLADVTLAGGSLLEQRYRLELRVQNPNDREIAVRGLDYELRLNERPFATGVSSAEVTLPAYGTQVVELEAFSGLREFVEQFLEVGRRGSGVVRYRLTGHVRLASPPVTLPFDRSGEFSLVPSPRGSRSI